MWTIVFIVVHTKVILWLKMSKYSVDEKKIRSNLSAAGKKESWYCSNDLANPVKYFEFVF